MKLVALMTVVPLPEAETDRKGSCAAFNHNALLIPFARIGEPDWTHEHALEGGDLLGARRP